MISKNKKTQSKRNNKLELHPRNPHNKRYDFDLLADSCPDLSRHIKLNQYGNNSIDFSDADAVKALNRALLNHFYGVAFWDIPAGFLCPPIPGRADYIHYLADLLANSNGGTIPRGKHIKVLDVGVGANCVYPIIGHQEYAWQFVGSDVNSIAIAACDSIIKSNNSLKSAITTRMQKNQNKVFDGILKEKDRFDLTLCNPPFHTSESAMKSESSRKWRGVQNKAPQTPNPKLNFGGTSAELWCDGGETGFINRMVKESAQYADQCFWFTSLVSRQENLEKIYKTIKDVGAKHVKTISMAQGQKISRFVAWSFLDENQIEYWKDYYWQG